MYILKYTTENFALHYPKKDRSQYVFFGGRIEKSVMMIKVKVNSKSELVEDREGKISAIRCNLLFVTTVLLSRAVICSHTV